MGHSLRSESLCRHRGGTHTSLVAGSLPGPGASYGLPETSEHEGRSSLVPYHQHKADVLPMADLLYIHMPSTQQAAHSSIPTNTHCTCKALAMAVVTRPGEFPVWTMAASAVCQSLNVLQCMSVSVYGCVCAVLTSAHTSIQTYVHLCPYVYVCISACV